MRTSLQGKLAILGDEAIVLTRYKDSAGIWTIGAGVTDAAGAEIKPSKFKGEITLTQAFDMFERVLVKYEKAVNRAVKVPLKQHQFDALVSFHYNTGAIARASLTKKLNRGDRVGASEGLLAWNKAGGKVNKGLVRRREAEKHLFDTGLYGDGQVSLYRATSRGKVIWSSGRRVNAMRELGIPETVDLPDERIERLEAVAEDAAAVDRRSMTKLGAAIGGGGSILQTGAIVTEKVKEAQSIFDIILTASPWVVAAVVCVGAWYLVNTERNRKSQQAQEALA